MSNKIKELAGQALDKVVPYTWTNLNYDELWALQEYFGKLIVKECVDICYDEDFATGGGYARAIMRKFEVE